MSFAVDKWYLDLVTRDGLAVVGYRLSVRWLAFDLQVAARLLAAPGAAPDERSALGETAAPEVDGRRLSWSPRKLGLQATWQAIDAPILCTLLESPAGRIEWSCLMPRAHASAVIDGTRHDGLGYAEHLRLTLPPWSFPFHTVRWGRHVSDQHALVWIEWEGAHPRQSVWLDGVPQPEARVVPAGVDGLTGAARALRWRQSHDITRRHVGATLARVAPALGAMVAGRLSGMQEHKQCSRSALVDAEGRAIDDGWAIHEVVTW